VAWLCAGWAAGVLAGGAHAAGVATTGENLLKVNVGARELAMGGAGAALVGDLSGVLANPALLSAVGSRSLMLMHWPGLAESRTEFASYAAPLGRAGLWAGSVLFRSLPPVDNEEAADAPVTYSDGMILLTFARPMGTGASHGGASVKVFNSEIGESRATSVALDVGALFQTAGRFPLWYGFGVANLGNPVKHEEAGEPLPLALRGGGAWSRDWFPHRLTLAAEVRLNAEQNARAALGIEWIQAGRLALRAGGAVARYGRPAYSLGLGWQFRSTVLGPEAEYHLDYAYLPFAFLSSFEPTHGFAVFVKF
jgi:hypothetical protein